MGYIEEKRKKKNAKETKKALLGQVCAVDRRGIGIIVFQARGRGKEPFLFMGMGSWRINFVSQEIILCEIIGIEKLCA